MHFHLKNSKGKETNPWIIILLHIKSHFVCQNIREVFIVLGIYHLVVHTIIKARPMRANMEFEFTVSDFWALTYYSNLYYLSYGYDFATAVKSLFVMNSSRVYLIYLRRYKFNKITKNPKFKKFENTYTDEIILVLRFSNDYECLVLYFNQAKFWKKYGENLK